mgnify:CR=1 FL=1|jgi:hypothetical protein
MMAKKHELIINVGMETYHSWRNGRWIELIKEIVIPGMSTCRLRWMKEDINEEILRAWELYDGVDE